LGQVGQTAHFRSVTRHNVHTWPSLLIVRIDDSLYFANIDSVTQYINHALQQQPHTQHVILVFSAVS
jgi:SulP family sulfate permease